ncbi:MAG TPA: hypothetical protein VKY90_11460 [Candidatus Dormibacteraeota bacterium]|nr:hypothetical protein [Candidatus Dormibacteraeota bacterium]
MSAIAHSAATEVLIRQTLCKCHAAGYLTHGAIESVRRLREEEGLGPGQVERLRLIVAPPCSRSAPSTDLESGLNLATTVAMALLGHDTGDPRALNDLAVRGPGLEEVRRWVEVATDPGLGEAVPRAALTLRGGVVRSVQGSGAPQGRVVLGLLLGGRSQPPDGATWPTDRLRGRLDLARWRWLWPPRATGPAHRGRRPA